MKKVRLKLGLMLLSLLCTTFLVGCKEQVVEEKQKNNDSLVWTYDVESKIYSTPVNYENNIIFGASNGNVYAIDKDTQKEAWKVEGKNSINNTPIINGENIIFSTKDSCFSLNAKTGKENWKFTKEIQVKESINGYDYHMASPVIYNDEVIYTTPSGTVFGLNKNDGKEVWSYKNDSLSSVRTTPAINSDIMVLGDIKGNVWGVDLKTKKTLWTKSIGTTVVHSVIADDGIVYSTGRDCKVIAMDIKTGDNKWSWIDKSGSWLTGDMVVYEEKLLVPGSDNHKIAILNKNDGKEISSAYGTANIFSKPVIVDNIMYFTDGNVYTKDVGGAYAYDLKQEKIVWSCTDIIPVYSTPLVIGDIIYYGGEDGKLYAAKVSK